MIIQRRVAPKDALFHPEQSQDENDSLESHDFAQWNTMSPPQTIIWGHHFAGPKFNDRGFPPNFLSLRSDQLVKSGKPEGRWPK